jgi:hypothetical protein
MPTQEIAMAPPPKNAKQSGPMAAKEERARDAALAMQEYKAERLAISAKTARLRALRLAKEAETRQDVKPKAPASKVVAAAGKLLDEDRTHPIRARSRTR